MDHREEHGKYNIMQTPLHKAHTIHGHALAIVTKYFIWDW